MNYPWDVEAKPIDEIMDSIYRDEYHGHIVARREWTDEQDHVACVHVFESPRGSVHLAGPYPHYLFYAHGERLLSTLAPDVTAMSSPAGFIGGKTTAFTDLGGGSYIHAADLSSKYIYVPTLKERKAGVKVDPNPKAQVTRQNAVIFIDDETTVYALLDQEHSGQEIRSNFSTGLEVTVSGNSFTLGDRAKGVVVGLDGDVIVKDSTILLAAERIAAEKARKQAEAAHEEQGKNSKKNKKRQKEQEGKQEESQTS